MTRDKWTDTWEGGQVSDCISCIVADNASPYTFNGSSSWIIDSRDGESCIVIDPGPDASHHIEILASACARQHGRVLAILGTHNHGDHLGGAEHFAQLVKAPALSVANGSLKAGPIDIPGFGRTVECIPTPGHSEDSVAFLMSEESALFIGDTCFENCSSLINYPDGNLSEYVDSTTKLVDIIESQNIQHVLPGHKGPMTNAAQQLRKVVAGRLKRVSQIVESCQAGAPFDCDVLVNKLYGDIRPGLSYAVRVTTLSSMKYVIEHDLLPGLADPKALDVPLIV